MHSSLPLYHYYLTPSLRLLLLSYVELLKPERLQNLRN